jgi:hypothetical protein
MSKIVSFRMGKGRTVRPTEGEEWVRKYLELEVTLPEKLTEEGFHEALLRAEQLIDSWLESAEVGAGAVPSLDPAELDSLPWKNVKKEPAKPGEFGWLFGPGSVAGSEPGTEKLVEALRRAKDKTLVIGDMEYSLVKDEAFIQRRPVKKSL